VKLQAVETHLNGNVYVKHQVVIPNNIIEQAGIHGGDDLTAEVDRNGRIVLSRQLLLPKPMKLTYPM
jgi:bifunctional DNA-binding transcriptional regulator/antitoxin component of YhaV-PrlF toxin-antitoxin module